MTRRLCIIPARGGSKRLPDKNIRPFHGLPMIGHSLNSARASGLFHTIHVSTDSDRIREVVTGMGFAVHFPRPPELADDHTPLRPVLRYVVEQYLERGERFDQVFLLMATAPMIDAEDLRGASALFEQAGGTRPVMSVSAYPVPVEWAYRREADGGLTPREPGMFAIRSQDLVTHYYDAGCYYLFPPAHILESEGAGSDTQFLGQVIPKWKGVDIDDAESWEQAELLYQAHRQALRS